MTDPVALNYDVDRDYAKARFADGTEAGWSTHVPPTCTAHPRPPCPHTEALARLVPEVLIPEEVDT